MSKRRIISESERYWRKIAKGEYVRPFNLRSGVKRVDDLTTHELKAMLAWALQRLREAESSRAWSGS